MVTFKSLLKAYVKNIFTGKIETLLGLILFTAVIVNYWQDGVLDMNDYGLLVGGFALLGIRFGSIPKKEDEKSNPNP